MVKKTSSPGLRAVWRRRGGGVLLGRLGGGGKGGGEGGGRGEGEAGAGEGRRGEKVQALVVLGVGRGVVIVFGGKGFVWVGGWLGGGGLDWVTG